MGRSPGFQWWQKRGKQEEGGAWRDTRAALSGPSKPPPALSTWLRGPAPLT